MMRPEAETIERPRVHRTWVKSDKLNDFEEVSDQYMHIFNLYPIFGENGIKDLEDQLLANGWNGEQMLQAQKRGIQKSNWNKNSYIAHRIESTGQIPIKVTHQR